MVNIILINYFDKEIEVTDELTSKIMAILSDVREKVDSPFDENV